MFRISGIAIRSLVVGFVNDTVTVEVNDIVVTDENLTVVLLTLWRTIEFIVGTDKAVVDEWNILTLRIALSLTIGRNQSRVILYLNNIVRVRVVGIGPETHAVVQYLIEADLNLETVVLHLTLVDIRRGCSTKVWRHWTVGSGDEDVVTVIAEPVKATCEHAMEEGVIETDIFLQYGCPTEIRLSNSSFLISNERTCRTVEWDIETITVVRYLPTCQVSPTCTSVIITDFTDRSTDLEHINDTFVFQLLHEFLFWDHPTGCSWTEECKAIVWRELLRTIVSTVELCEIPALIVVCSTEHPVLTTILEVGITCVDTTLPVTHQRDVMVTELTSPEELERHFRCAACIADATCFGRPVALFIEIETCFRIDFIFPNKLAFLRNNVCSIVDVTTTGSTDTTTTLVKLVVPRDRSASDKTLCDEIEILFKGKVSEYAGDGRQLITWCWHAHRRVRHVWSCQSGVTPGAICKLNGIYVRRHTIGTGPVLLLEELTAITVIITRRLLLGIRTSQVYLELSRLRNLEVKIWTYIQTVVCITAFITLVVIPDFGHITFVLEVECYEILHKLGTTRKVDVRIVR